MNQFTALAWEEIFLGGISKRRNRIGRLKFELVRKIADLKSRAGCYSFPTDVDRLAYTTGIHGIRYIPLSVRGRLVREPGGLFAEINSDLFPHDKRFVLAHEISHLLLEKDAINVANVRVQRESEPDGLGYKLVEMLCDFGAREILLPGASLKPELKNHAPSLQLIADIASEADCSMEIVAHRVCEPLSEWSKISFLWWKVIDHDATLRQIIPSSAASIELPDANNSLILRALSTSKVVSGNEAIWVGTEQHIFAVQALSLSKDEVVALVSPRIY